MVVWIPGPIPTILTSNSLIWPLKTKGIAYLHHINALIIGITLIIGQLQVKLWIRLSAGARPMTNTRL